MFHTIIILGNVGRDPELRYTPSGQGVTTFSVASNRQYNSNDGQQVKETIWFRVTAWGKTAEVCNQYLRKGMRVFIEGRLRPDTNGSPKVFCKRSNSTGEISFPNIPRLRRIFSRPADLPMIMGIAILNFRPFQYTPTENKKDKPQSDLSLG